MNQRIDNIIRLLCFMCILFISNTIFSQRIPETGRPTAPDTASVRSAPDTAQVKRNSFLSIFNGKPGKAALIGLLIPGGGQAYNKKWLKIPIALGIDGTAGAWVWFTRKTYNKYDGTYKSLLAGGTSNVFRSANDVLVVRSKWRQNSEYAWVYMTIAHLVTVFDAYVDRHLIEFDISDDLSNLYNANNQMPIVGIAIPLSPSKKENKAIFAP